MISKIYGSNFFAKSFTIGLLLLFVNIVKDFLGELAGFSFPASISTVLFVTGLTICLIGMLFLLIEWMTLPFGMQTKRIKLYQGVGNLIALLMFVSAWFVKEQMAFHNINVIVLTLAFTGLITALVYGLAGKTIANSISRKKIDFYGLEKSRSANREILSIEKIKTSEQVNITEISQKPAVQH